MKHSTGRRYLSNYLINRGGLARLSVPFIILAALSIGIIYEMSSRVMTALEHTELQGIENLTAVNQLHTMQASVTMFGVVGAIVLILMCLLLWVVYSHRVFGPMIPLRRHVQKLKEGDYSSRVILRGKDEFKELAADLNELAELLAKKKS